MNIFFDMDYTIVGGMDGSLRPGTREVFEQLVELGHDLYIWSGVGVRSAEVRDVGLEPFVKGVFQKPLSNFPEGLVRYGIPVVPDFVVDDYQQIVRHFGGHCIKEYVRKSGQEGDEEMYAIPGHISAYLALTSPPAAVDE